MAETLRKMAKSLYLVYHRKNRHNKWLFRFIRVRAMHLYQEGMDLTLISQWLGHSQLETTQIYAHADTEHKRKAIEAATPQENPLTAHLNSARFTVNDEEMLKKLVELK